MAFNNWTVEMLKEYIYRANRCGMSLACEEIEQEMERMHNPHRLSFVTEWDVLFKYENLHIQSLKEELAWYEDGCPMEDISLDEEIILDAPEILVSD